MKKFFLGFLFFSVATALPAQSQHHVDLIITGGTVVTMDASRHIYNGGAVAVRDGTIVAVGSQQAIVSRYIAARTIDARGEIVMPGLIDGHAHAAMSLFRGLADDLSLNDWLHNYIFPAEARNVTPDFVKWGTRLGVLEMLRGGITTYADMYYFEDEVARVTKQAGMRGVLGETIIDFPAPDNKTVPQALAYTATYIKRWQGDPLITPAVAPHSIYTCSTKTLQAAAALARKYHAPILIHVAEAPFESAMSHAKYGLSPVAYLESIGFLGPDVTAAHCVWVDAGDMVLLAARDVGCVNNPSSNMKLADGVSPVVGLIAAGVPEGLGTDGAASNNDLDMFREMDLAAKLQKVARMDPRALPAEQAVAMATINGARALHMDKQIGSLEPGKKADVIIIRTDAPHATPMYNVYSELVYALQASDVDTVIVGGKIVMDHRKMLTLDEPQILAKARDYAKRVTASLAAPAK
ncbi:MAG TPA: amidohydrolase [Candidatus Limnocylindrales bacterium]|nr:amidohydrolase [Candidatus Limnocylindrales bacterium]